LFGESLNQGTDVKDKLTPYEVPKTIEFMDELPLTTLGKIDKEILKEKEGK